MTLAEAGEIFAYWENDPPVHLIGQAIARMFGWIPRPIPAAAMRAEDIAAAPPPGLIVAPGGAIGMPAPLLDPDAMRLRNRALAVEIARRHQDRG